LTANADVETIVVASQDQPRPKELVQNTKTAKEMIGKQSKITQASMDSSDRNEAKFE